MCLKILTYTFVLISILFVIHFITLMCGITKKMEPMHASSYVSFSAATLLMYLINAGLILLMTPLVSTKIIIAVFMALPFIIGKLATYPNLKYFSVFQVLCVIMSAVYVLII